MELKNINQKPWFLAPTLLLATFSPLEWQIYWIIKLRIWIFTFRILKRLGYRSMLLWRECSDLQGQQLRSLIQLYDLITSIHLLYWGFAGFWTSFWRHGKGTNVAMIPTNVAEGYRKDEKPMKRFCFCQSMRLQRAYNILYRENLRKIWKSKKLINKDFFSKKWNKSR